jgi:diadenosine tetraphosphate (Ap4A) HIT family hydrolase
LSSFRRRERIPAPDRRHDQQRSLTGVTTACPFCERVAAEGASTTVVSFADAFPVSHGHTLVVPRRHVADFFRLSDREQQEAWRLVDAVRARLEREHRPDGFNIGLNVGNAGGQTVEHTHIHVIPRYLGDVPDPRGGIRWVIPEKAPYWDAGR